MYNFHELIIDILRPTLKEGVRSIILASPARTNYAERFIEHVHGHHSWLVKGPNKAFFHEINGSAGSLSEVSILTKNPEFNRQICDTTSEETENLVDMLEKHVNTSNQGTIVLYSLEEIEDLILDPKKLGRSKPEYLMLTNKYLLDSLKKNRLQRIIQIATNRNVKIRIVDAESTAGLRLTQLGGLVCF